MTAGVSSSARKAQIARLLGHRAAFSVLFLSLLVVAAYFESWRQVAAAWSDDTSRVAHGWLVLPVLVAFLFLNLPGEVAWSSARDRWRWLALGLFASVLWLSTVLLSIESVGHFFALLILAISMHVVFDRTIARETDRCLLVLVFALPVLDTVNGIFQKVSIAVAGSALHLLHVPAQLQGFLVTLPSGSFEIEPLCSGLQFFIAATTTGALLSAMQRASWPRTLLVIAGAAAIGLIANWLRVVIVIVAGYLSDMQNYLVHSEHFTLGWALFALGVGGYVFWIGRRWPPPPAVLERGVSHLPAAVWIAVAALGTAPLWLSLAVPRELPPRVAEPAAFNADTWRGPMATGAAWAREPRVSMKHIVTDYIAADGERVTALVARYETPERNSDTFLSVTHFLPAPAWQLNDSAATEVIPVGGTSVTARRALVSDPFGKPWVFIYWYQVGTRVHATALQARADYFRSHLAGPMPPFLLFVFASPCAIDCVAQERAAGNLAAEAAVPLASQILE